MNQYFLCCDNAGFEYSQCRRGSRGGSGGLEPPPPWIFKIYISENNIFSVVRGYFYMHIENISGSLRSPIIISIYVSSALLFDDFADCLGNFKVVHRSYKCILSAFATEQHANFSESVKVQMLFTKNLQNKQFLHFFKIYNLIIPSIFNFSFKERDCLLWSL